MTDLGTAEQAIVYASTLDDDASDFCSSWKDKDIERIEQWWPVYLEMVKCKDARLIAG